MNSFKPDVMNKKTNVRKELKSAKENEVWNRAMAPRCSTAP